jgi:hypothetical protein
MIFVTKYNLSIFLFKDLNRFILMWDHVQTPVSLWGLVSFGVPHDYNKWEFYLSWRGIPFNGPSQVRKFIFLLCISFEGVFWISNKRRTFICISIIVLVPSGVCLFNSNVLRVETFLYYLCHFKRGEVVKWVDQRFPNGPELNSGIPLSESKVSARKSIMALKKFK